VAERRPHAALVALMVTGLLLAVTWAVTLPAFQAPDEQSHFTYVQSIGERFALPGEEGRPFFSTELSQGIAAVNSDQVAAQKEVRPEWSDRLEDRWAATQGEAPRDDGGGPGPASNYPPTAYAWEALGYLAASGGTVYDAVLGARLMSALWVPITVLATWLLAGEIFGRRRVLQAAAAAVPALAPMFSFVSGSVSPDGMMYAIWTLALWTGVRCVRRGVPLREAAVFLALVALACTVKSTSYALLVPALVLVVLGIAARRPSGARSVLRLTAAVVIPVALVLGLWVLAASSTDRSPGADQLAAGQDTNWRELGSYLWQYYLPKPPFLTKYPTPPGGYPLLQVWITQGWAAFGWLEVKFEPWVYRVLGVLTMSVFGAGAVALVRARHRIDWRVVAFLGAACLALLAGLHWTDYHKLENGEPAFMQARYLFPVISVMGLALAGAVSLAPVRARGALAGAAIAGLLVFHLFALGLTLERFYA
jgi:4-amino-4-deoxy-L-arabinose transferase-like glycosyltransferase